MTYLVPHSPEKEICISNSGSLSGMTFLCKDMCDIIVSNCLKINSPIPHEIENWLGTLDKAIVSGGNGGYRQILAAVK